MADLTTALSDLNAAVQSLVGEVSNLKQQLAQHDAPELQQAADAVEAQAAQIHEALATAQSAAPAEPGTGAETPPAQA